LASFLHGNARATPRVRAELQASQESSRILAARCDPNPKTVARWKNRAIKHAAIKAFHYDNLDSLKARALAFVAAFNFAKHLKALRW